MNTGYALITRNILQRLQTQYNWDCYNLGHNYVGQKIQNLKFADGSKIDFTLLGVPPQPPEIRIPYAKDLILPYIDRLKVDAFGILLDLFMTNGWLQNMHIPTNTFFYFPSDGGQVVPDNAFEYYREFFTPEQMKDYLEFIETGILPLGCADILQKMKRSVAMSKFGQRQAWKVHGIKTDYIPHGVDVDIFFPLPSEGKKELKNKVVVMSCTGALLQGALKNKFVVGVVGRNQGRKMHDRAIKAFAFFAKNKPDAVLLLHLDPYDIASPFNIIEYIKFLNIHNKVFFTGMKWFDGFSTYDLRNVYNTFDVYFSSSSGEGFGICSIEALACGIPAILPDYTSTYELLVENGRCGEPVLMNDVLLGTWNVPRGIMSIPDAVHKLNKLYYDAKLRDHYSKVGLKKIQEYYDWNVIMPQWDKFLKELTT
ncbi:MAG: glycosyltransferase family 4 protein [Candidatus Altarchaeum sp.]|nr:glycosyltransferase family 4 protein [Candidatus Altarchaeum sp.]